MKVSDIQTSLARSGYKIVNGPSYSGRLLSNTATDAIIKDTILQVLGHISFLSDAMYIARTANALFGPVNYEQIGGVFTLSFYVKKLLNPDHRNVNVPVPHEFFYVTYVLDADAPINSNVVYTNWISDGIRLSNV